MLDKKDPVTMAMITLIVSFALLVGIIYLAKPQWIQFVDTNTGKSSIAWKLIISYSATFALVCAIAVILIVSKKRGANSIVAYPIQSQFPSSTMASAYCGTKHLT